MKVLAELQSMTANRIPFPFAGWSTRVQEVALNASLATEEDAKTLWGEMLGIVEEETKPTISPCIAELRTGTHWTDRVLLGNYPGVHQPRMDFQFSKSDKEDPGALFERALNDPKEGVSVESAVRVSPPAALCFLMEKGVHQNSIHPGMLAEVQSKSVAEHRTRLEYRWYPVRDHMWYNLTPFHYVLTALEHYERWLIESNHFSGEKNDFPRAYVAAKEAHRCAPEVTDTCVNLGWHAFTVDRVCEAISVTEQVLEGKEGGSLFPAIINLGLFCLRRAQLVSQKREEYRKDAQRHYDGAAQTLRELPMDAALLRIEEAISDIQRFRDQLDSDAQNHLDRFRALRSEILNGSSCSAD